jgi:hypothetical protein
MSGVVDVTDVSPAVEDLYSAIEESARLLDVPCSRDEVLSVLAAYSDGLAEAMTVLAMAGGGERHRGELDYNFTVPSGGVDPYTVAVSNGFVERTDHPVGSLLADIQARCPILNLGVECGLVGGFKKLYAFFPLDNLQRLSDLAEIPSMPRALADNAATFARYGLDDKVSIIGIDYVRKTMNVYFGRFPEETVLPETVLAMVRDFGLPEPNEQMLEFIRKSFSIYPTFSWDSSEIKRVCFSVVTPDAEAFPARMDPEIGKFARNAPHAYPGERVLVYGATLSPDGEYYKLGCYYRKPPEVFNKWQLFDKIVERA